MIDNFEDITVEIENLKSRVSSLEEENQDLKERLEALE